MVDLDKSELSGMRARAKSTLQYSRPGRTILAMVAAGLAVGADR